MKKFNSVIYALLGGLALLYGVLILISPAIISARAAERPDLRHVLREEAAAGVFIGLMALWCIFNYDRRKWVHYALIVFAFLMAAIHWADYFSEHLPLISPLYNTVPTLVLLIIAPWSSTRLAKE